MPRHLGIHVWIESDYIMVAGLLPSRIDILGHYFGLFSRNIFKNANPIGVSDALWSMGSTS